MRQRAYGISEVILVLDSDVHVHIALNYLREGQGAGQHLFDQVVIQSGASVKGFWNVSYITKCQWG